MGSKSQFNYQSSYNKHQPFMWTISHRNIPSNDNIEHLSIFKNIRNEK